MNIKKIIIMGLLITSNLFLNLNLAYAEVDLDYYSPIDYTEDDYIRFGDSEHPQEDDYLMSISPDESSISAQWIDITFQINEPGLAENKSIDKFLILANGKIVDYIYPQYEIGDRGMPVIADTYVAKPSIPELTGTDVYFQVVAVTEVEGAQSAVAWTGYSETLTMDDLPVYDKEAVSVLNAILDKLRELLGKLKDIEGLLSKISNQIETLLTPSSEAMERFENAQQELWEKMPSKQMADKTNEIADMFDETKSMLDEPQSQLQFGEKRDWFMIGQEVYLFDLTGFEQQITMLRHLLSAVIWIEFLFFLLFYLAPKFDI